MKINGACHCGAIQYEATVDPQKAGVCHCTDCQALSGAPFRASVPANAEDFHLLRGMPQVYVKTADSGANRAQGFCANCGSSIYSTDAEHPAVFMLRLGAVKQRREIVPRKQVWCASAVPWIHVLNDMSASEKG